MNAIKMSQIKRPLPDLNYARPKLDSISFSKAERFKKIKEYEVPTYLFRDGIFAPKTQEDFFINYFGFPFPYNQFKNWKKNIRSFSQNNFNFFEQLL